MIREWRVPYLLDEKDMGMHGESEESLSRIIEEFGRVCERVNFESKCR